MGIRSEKESCLSCDEKHNDIWFKAADRVDAVPSTDPPPPPPPGRLCLLWQGEAAGWRDRPRGELDELSDTNTFWKMFGESTAGRFSMPSLMNPQKGNFWDARNLQSKGDILYEEHFTSIILSGNERGLRWRYLQKVWLLLTAVTAGERETCEHCPGNAESGWEAVRSCGN